MGWIIWAFVAGVVIIFVGVAWLAMSDKPHTGDAVSDLDPSWFDPSDDINKGI